MSQKNYKEIVSLSEWQVAHLRLTAFPEPSIKIQEIEWWKEIVGESPESKTSRPKSGELREEGPFDAGVLTLNIRPLRIDWHFTKVYQNELPEDDLPTIGEFPKSIESFFTLMQKWLENDCPELGRIAFGAILLLPVQSRPIGYKRLSSYLPNVELDPEESSDFLYQINRPRNSKLSIPNLMVNRLCKWSVAVFVHTLVQLSHRTGRSEQISSPEVHSCRLELDINTAADFKNILPQDRLVSVFEELVELGKEIAEKGDVK